MCVAWLWTYQEQHWLMFLCLNTLDFTGLLYKIAYNAISEIWNDLWCDLEYLEYLKNISIFFTINTHIHFYRQLRVKGWLYLHAFGRNPDTTAQAQREHTNTKEKGPSQLPGPNPESSCCEVPLHHCAGTNFTHFLPKLALFFWLHSSWTAQNVWTRTT